MLNLTALDISKNSHSEAATPPGYLTEPPPVLVKTSGSVPVVFNREFEDEIPSAELLRKCAWEIGEAKAADAAKPLENHVGLAYVAPHQGLVHWRIQNEWIDRISKEKGNAWHHCRLIVRLYDVTHINFNGFNAHAIQNLSIPNICGQQLFALSRAGTVQLAEVGFELKSGEFIPAARSQCVQFPPVGASSRTDHAALLVDDKLRVEAVENIWEQDAILAQRRRPKLREKLRIATFAFESAACGHQSSLAKFVSELASGQVQHGHEVHVFIPRSEFVTGDKQLGGVHYHAVDVALNAPPVDIALEYAAAAEQRLQEFPEFDLYHLHEWMTGVAPWIGTRPTLLSITSTETTRLNGAEPTPASREIQKIERDLIQVVDCILTPPWLRDKALAEFGLDEEKVKAFPMEGRLPTEWDCDLDIAKLKNDWGLGAGSRLVLYIGPLEYNAGVDILIEAMTITLQRAPNAKLGIIGLGSMHDQLMSKAHHCGVAHAVRMFGHLDGHAVAKLLRAAEAVVLPSRGRVDFDEAVVHLARKASRAVVTTKGGPCHLVAHEENGIVTYDNPGSMVWALDRILGDSNNTARLGKNGRSNGSGNGSYSWKEVAALYLDVCAEHFPELRQAADI